MYFSAQVIIPLKLTKEHQPRLEVHQTFSGRFNVIFPAPIMGDILLICYQSVSLGDRLRYLIPPASFWHFVFAAQNVIVGPCTHRTRNKWQLCYAIILTSLHVAYCFSSFLGCTWVHVLWVQTGIHNALEVCSPHTGTCILFSTSTVYVCNNACYM